MRDRRSSRPSQLIPIIVTLPKYPDHHHISAAQDPARLAIATSNSLLGYWPICEYFMVHTRLAVSKQSSVMKGRLMVARLDYSHAIIRSCAT